MANYFETQTEEKHIIINDAYNNYKLKKKIKFSDLDVIAKNRDTFLTSETIDADGTPIYSYLLHYPLEQGELYAIGGKFFKIDLKYYEYSNYSEGIHEVRILPTPIKTYGFPASTVTIYNHYDRYYVSKTENRLTLEPIYLEIKVREDGKIPLELNDSYYFTLGAIDGYLAWNPNKYCHYSDATLKDINLYIFTSEKNAESQGQNSGLQLFKADGSLLYSSLDKTMNIISTGGDVDFSDETAEKIECAIVKYQWTYNVAYTGYYYLDDTYTSYSNLQDSLVYSESDGSGAELGDTYVIGRKNKLHLASSTLYTHKNGIFNLNYEHWKESFGFPYILDVTGF